MSKQILRVAICIINILWYELRATIINSFLLISSIFLVIESIFSVI